MTVQPRFGWSWIESCRWRVTSERNVRGSAVRPRNVTRFNDSLAVDVATRRVRSRWNRLQIHCAIVLSGTNAWAAVDRLANRFGIQEVILLRLHGEEDPEQSVRRTELRTFTVRITWATADGARGSPRTIPVRRRKSTRDMGAHV